MSHFDTFFSNSLAPHNVQKFFAAPSVTATRTFARIEVGGTYRYSFFFANSIASTFSDGSESFANYVCDTWQLYGMKVGLCGEGFTPNALLPVTFEGKTSKTVAPGEIFWSDPITLTARDGDNLCLELTYEGAEIPYLEEALITVQKQAPDGTWETGHFPTPCPIMIGCDRPVRTRVAFIGDSITEGLGTPVDAYAGYATVAARAWGKDVAVWNIGLGFGRGADAAMGGLWHYEAKQADTVIICFGVNDILRDFTAHEVKKNLTTVVRRLKGCGKRVCIQTVPPFDMKDEKRAIWNEVNDYIRDVLAKEADFFFDNRPVLCMDAPDDNLARYGGHPNVEGARLWGEALAAAFKP